LPDSFSTRVLPSDVRVSYGPARNWFLAFLVFPFRLLFRRYDFVFSTFIYTNALLSLLRRFRLAKIGTLILRESTSIFDRVKAGKRRLAGQLYRQYGGEDLLIAQTTYMAEHVRPWLPRQSAGRLRVLPNPVNAAAIERDALAPLESDLSSRLDNHLNVLFCGRLIPIKRPEIALEAFRLAAEDNEELQLVYLGGGPLEPDVKAGAVKAGLADRVIFLGARTNPFPVIARCHYGLVTSSKEGFPNAVLEMMACGLRKIFVTPCAGDLDMLEGVEVTGSFDPQEIGNALRQAIATGENFRETYRACARSRSVGAYLDELLDVARCKWDRQRDY
jgi:glycosyltransferase involved in cell wall biosynthesis